MKFHHIGIACIDIPKTANFIHTVFNIVSETEIFFDKYQDVYLCLLTDEFGINIELVSGKIVEGYVKKKQNLYHTCWEVTDITKTIENFCTSGAVLISKPNPAVLFDNRKVAFLYTEIGIVELLEGKIIG